MSIALGSVGPTIIRAHDAEAWLMKATSLRDGAQLEPLIAQEFGRRVAQESRPIDDHRSTAEYRRHAVGVLAQRLLLRSFS